MGTTAQLVVDGLLVAGFGVQHSILATLRVKRVVKAKTGIEALAWRSVESLSNVLYILCAGALWQHTHDVVWRLGGAPMVILYVLAAASWVWYWELHLFEYDCGLAFGSTTLVAQLAGAQGPKLISWKIGSRRWIRFPVHTAFFGMFFLLPTMTTDLLLLAIVLNTYNVIGSILYDKRLLTLAGDAYRPYIAVTGLIWPPVYRAPRGASDLAMPAPRHWRKPTMHLPGLVVGLGLGVLYFFLIGASATTPMGMLRAGGTGLLAAVLSGLIIGTVSKPDSSEWGQQQTDLSTTVALSAAVGVITWASIGWIHTGSAPGFAAFLPLWFIVQYLGHVFAFLANRKKWSASLVPVEESVPQTAGDSMPVGMAASTATKPLAA
jgi:protein-S-isoprenylcysteine O-methyltransferase Ste14